MVWQVWQGVLVLRNSVGKVIYSKRVLNRLIQIPMHRFLNFPLVMKRLKIVPTYNK